MEKPESGTGTGTGTLKIETRVNWETLKPVPDTRVEIKFKMASSVIIVLRNFQHSDRDTKDILIAQKRLLLVIWYTHVFYFIKHAYTSRLDTFTRKKQTNKQNIQL